MRSIARKLRIDLVSERVPQVRKRRGKDMQNFASRELHTFTCATPQSHRGHPMTSITRLEEEPHMRRRRLPCDLAWRRREFRKGKELGRAF